MTKKEEEAKVEELVNNGVKPNEGNEGNEVNTNADVDYKNICKKLVASGCKKLSNVRIKTVNVTEKDNYTMVSFTTSNKIPGYISNDNGNTYEKGETNIIYTSSFAIIGALKEDDELAWMANALANNPKAFNLIFSGANVDIIQQEISAGEEFTNPFSTRTDVEPQVYDHDIIVNHIISFHLSKIGEKMADKLADKLLGF